MSAKRMRSTAINIPMPPGGLVFGAELSEAPDGTVVAKFGAVTARIAIDGENARIVADWFDGYANRRIVADWFDGYANRRDEAAARPKRKGGG